MKVLNYPDSLEKFDKSFDKDCQVHLWCIPFNENLMDISVLSRDEIMRSAEYKFNVHKKHFVMYRCALRKILSYYGNKRPEEVMFGYTEYWKPYLLLNPEEIQFNLSYSNNLAVLAITLGCQIGVDVELVKLFDDMTSIAKQFFSAPEYSKLSSLPETGKVEAFYDIWTTKEAFIKAVGKGLSYPIDKVIVSFSINKIPKIIEIDGSTEEAKSWIVKSFNKKINEENYKISILYKKYL